MVSLSQDRDWIILNVGPDSYDSFCFCEDISCKFFIVFELIMHVGLIEAVRKSKVTEKEAETKVCNAFEFVVVLLCFFVSALTFWFRNDIV